ncbi:MAG: glutathione S-transferase [Candidatus Poriferisodalaceae bacterium]|jgi:glutathione S-transferase
MTEPDLTLIGAFGSPYSIKMRAVLRYRHIPFRWIARGSAQDVDIPEVPVAIIPVIAFHDGDGYSGAMVDSSPQIAKLESTHHGRSVVPTDPVVAFLDYLIEDYGDEWVTKVMYHYRWHHLYEAAIDKAGSLLSSMSDNQMSPEDQAQRKAFITNRQIGRTALVGSTDQNRPVIEDSHVRLLRIMNRHLTGHQFLLGSRPGRGDFGIFGQFSQLSFWEPDSAAVQAVEGPRAIIWGYQMDDLSSHEVTGDAGWFDRDTLPATTTELLAEIGSSYSPFMLANAKALQSGAAQMSCTIHGLEYSQGPFAYQGKCLMWLRQHYEALSTDDRTAVDAILAGTGCEQLVA